MSKDKETNHFFLENKKAKFNYELIEHIEAGIVLTGSEVKALREKKGNLTDSFAQIKQGEVLLQGLTIPPYRNRGYSTHQENRPRKLLLHSKEIRKWEKQVKEKGLVLVATKLYFNDKNMVKVLIYLAKPKKLYDKRDTIQKKEAKIEIERAFKNKSR
jgi:SsrA-binding protein